MKFENLLLLNYWTIFMIYLNVTKTQVTCIHLFELVSQVSDVAQRPLVLFIYSSSCVPNSVNEHCRHSRERLYFHSLPHDVCDRSCWMRSGYTFISLPLCRNHHLKYIARTIMQYMHAVYTCMLLSQGDGGLFLSWIIYESLFRFPKQGIKGQMISSFDLLSFCYSLYPGILLLFLLNTNSRNSRH